MRCSPSIVPPELSPANAGLLCVLTSPIGSIPEDTGSHSNQMVGAGRGLWGIFNETARVHHASRRRGRRLPVRGARAADAGAAEHREHRVLEPDDGFG